MGYLSPPRSLRFDSVLKGIDVSRIISDIRKVEGVIEVYHLPGWAICAIQNTMISHLFIYPDTAMEQLSIQ
ncbi:MAG: hypothetical protein AB9834_06030 [Lentimicrobium sp.]